MFRNILVPLDLTEKNRIAVQTAAELAQPSSGSITLLHVVETIQDVPFEELSDFYGKLRERAETAIETWAKELADRQLAIRREIVFGRRGPEIVRYAEEQQCDLVVLTSHQIDPERPAGSFGTISHQVALMALCPVLLMR